MKRLLILYAVALFSRSFGQATLLTGTSILIDPNTNVELLSTIPDTLFIAVGTSFINNGALHLSPFNAIQEKNGFPIKGTGFEKYTTFYATSLTGTEPGGLGCQLFTQVAADSFRIKRFHSVLNNGFVNGIGRNYIIESKMNSTLNAIVLFKYDSVELNASDPKLLQLYHQEQGNTTWDRIPGAAFKDYVKTTIPLNSLNLLSLFPFDPATGITVESPTDPVIMYPNPVSDVLYLTGELIHKLIIYDQLGNKIRIYRSFNQGTNTIDMKELPAGIYQFCIETGTRILNKRIIKF